MSLEVGRIVARVEGETAQFDKAMADAQRTFQVTAQKLDATGQQLANALRKTYSDRIVAANATADKEIQAARRSLNERLRASSSTAEVAALREQFNRRASAASEGARREVQAAQQQYLAASQGLRPVIAAANQLTATTALTTSQFSKLRTATVAVASAAAGAHPAFGQMSAVLGAMVGTGGVIALAVAAIAALGFAYNRATKDARELKEEQEKLNQQLERGGRARAGLTAGAENQAAAQAVRRMAEITARINELRTIPQFRTEVSGTEAVMVAVSQKETLAEITKLSKEYASEALKALEVDGKRAEEGQRVAEEAERTAEAFDRLVQSGRELDRDMGDILRKFNELASENAFAALQRFRLGDLSGSGGLITRPSATNAMPRNVQILSSTATSRWAASVKKAADQTGDVLGDAVKRMFDPKQILSGLATSGIATVGGLLVGMADDLLDFSGKAREAAKQMREAQRAWSRNLDDFIRSFAPEGEQKQGNTVSHLQDLINDFFKNFFKINPAKDKRAAQFVAISTMIQNSQTVQQIITQLTLLKNLFPEFGAEIDKMIHGATLAGESLNKTADAADAVTEALTNVPQGFKIALARFNATTPGLPTLPGPSSWTPQGGAMGGARMQAIHIETIEMNGVNDPQEFLRKLETEIVRQKARGGSGIALEFL